MTATAINYYEKGKRKISIDDLYRLAAALKKPVDYFLADVSQVDEKDTMGRGFFYDLTGIPVIGLIKAGEPVCAEQNITGCIPFPHDLQKGTLFFLEARGDSMSGIGICDGDLVLIRRQSGVDFNGQVVCALVDGKESTLKIFFQENDGRIFLKAANPNYPDIVLGNGKELVIQGVYAGVFKFPRMPVETEYFLKQKKILFTSLNKSVKGSGFGWPSGGRTV